jgi:Copper transport outer membrane protein, MctB
VIGFRYHLVSLAAVLLAVALGVLLGTTQLSGAIGDDQKAQIRTLTKDNGDLQAQVRTQTARGRSDDTVTAQLAPRLVAGALKGAKVVVVATPQATDAGTDGVTKALQQAGATVTGRVQLTDGYSDPRRAEDAKSYVTGGSQPAGFQLPESEDAGVLSGALLSYALLGDKKGDPAAATTSEILSGFSTLKMLRTPDGTVAAGDLAVVVSDGAVPGPDPAPRLATLSALVSSLDNAGGGVVVAGGSAAAGGTGLIGVLRADQGLASAVSSVDDADRPVGRVATVFALAQESAGQSGQYGTAAGAEEPFPPLSSS